MSSQESDQFTSDSEYQSSSNALTDDERPVVNEPDTSNLTFEQRKQMLGRQGKTQKEPRPSEGGFKKKFKRSNKNCPQEITSKKAVSRKRVIIDVPEKRRVDPRFDPLCGNLNKDIFHKNYSFLDDYRKSEAAEMKKELKKTKNSEKKRELSLKIDKIKSEIASREKEKFKEQVRRELKREELERVKEGKRPFYQKKSELKKIELQKTFEKLKGEGKDSEIQKMMEKKRKRTEKKLKKKIPRSR